MEPIKQPIKHNQEEGKACLECLEDPSIVLNDVEEKERLSTAMSSYYLLFR
ncbi:MAG: hypothetical protein H7X79_09800 [Sporomusaceae bacterium]|nr:hypothetical protein [Sporomusaceae bacterium]